MIQYILSTVLSFLAFANFSLATPSQHQDVKTVQVIAVFPGCNDSMRLFSFEGIAFRQLQTVKSRHDTFYFDVPASDPKFYFIGTSDQQKKAIILGQEQQVLISGDCKNMSTASIGNSPINDAYHSAFKESQELKVQTGQLIREFQQVYNFPEKRQAVIEKMEAVDAQKKELLKSTSEANPFVGKIIALDSYLSFHTHPEQHKNEIEHFINQYFKHANLGDPDYNNIPSLFEGFKNYTQTLATVQLPEQNIKEVVDMHLAQIPAESQAYKYALGGAVLGLQSKNNPAFNFFGARFVEKYGQEKLPAFQQLAAQVNAARSFATGAVAPDFTQNTPDDKPMSLSELRGKIVLIDFWASWCGPCRRENPHVVKLYQKYKDAGFDVIGVSLDRTKNAWVKAIEKDGLEWHHVSDLKGWSNVVAKAYAVRSIPHTVLLDREGRIIARNLRGDQLEKQLEILMKKE